MKSRSDLSGAKRIVIKIGSRLLADDVEGRVAMLAREVAAQKVRGVECLIVTSGAIALGRKRLGMKERPRTIPGLQAAAAVGQGHLVHYYERALSAVGLTAAQVLLTHDDVRNRRRYLNARHAMIEMIGLGAVPIINENDTVSVDEIKFGDNDRLAALVCSICEADLLIILTDVDGLYDGDPHDATAKIVTEAHGPDAIDALMSVAGGSNSGVGTGGMSSKLQAAKIAGRFGVATVIASGRQDDPVSAILRGDSMGSAFWPAVTTLQSRKHWIAFALKPAGKIIVDAGARRALVESGKSLLPSGCRAIDGSFGVGDAVSVVDEAGYEFARGLCNYDSAEIEKLAGRKSAEIETILGYKSVDEIVHRDDLVLL